jgi:hypothetical protein
VAFRDVTPERMRSPLLSSLSTGEKSLLHSLTLVRSIVVRPFQTRAVAERIFGTLMGH